MKKETIKSVLGLTQQEIAMLLDVTRSQYSHYERNTRDLPFAAGLRLNEMLTYMLSPETIAFLKEPETAYEDKETKQLLEKRLRENEFQLAVLLRKVNVAQEKLDKHQKAVRLMEFLNSPEEVKKTNSPKVLRFIESKTLMNFNKSKSQLNLLQMDYELLQLQQECLQKALRKLEI